MANPRPLVVALVLLSVVTTVPVASSSIQSGHAAGGTSAQALGDLAPRGRWDPGTASGEILLDRRSFYTVFQGEGDVRRWRDAQGNVVTGTTLAGVPGRGAGGTEFTLRGGVPHDQQPGSYASARHDLSVRVAEPRITDLDVFDGEGVRLRPGARVSGDRTLLVRAVWNFPGAEDVELELRNEDGAAIGDRALSTEILPEQRSLLPRHFDPDHLDAPVQGLGSTGYRTAYWVLDLSRLDAGNYHLRVSGVDDLDTGDAAAGRTIPFATDPEPTLLTGSRRVARGTGVRYTIGGATPGQFHAIAIPLDRLAAGADPAGAFRDGGDSDAVAVGSTDRFAYAVVNVPRSGVAAGSIDTTGIRRGQVEVLVFPGRSTVAGGERSLREERAVDRETVTVERGGPSATFGERPYPVGARVDVTGTAPGADRVALYVRGGGDWRLLPLDGHPTTPVRADGTWAVERVVPSEEAPGGRLIGSPGTYDLAVVPAGSLRSPPPSGLPAEAVTDRGAGRDRLRVTASPLVARFDAIGGELARGDSLAVEGAAATSDVVLVFVGEGGGVVSRVVSTNGGTFGARVRLGPLDAGRVTALAVTSGDDGIFGSGEALAGGGARASITSTREFTTFVDSWDRRRATGEGIVRRIRGATADRRGSDDRVIERSFFFTPPRTGIRDIVPARRPDRTGVVPVRAGERVLVRGTTNRNPRSTDLAVAMEGGSSGAPVASATTSSWGTNGTWSVALAVPGDVEPGTYRFRVADGRSASNRSVRIRPARSTPADRTTPRPTARQTPEPTPSPTGTPAPSPTRGSGGGFGALVPVVGLLLGGHLVARLVG